MSTSACSGQTPAGGPGAIEIRLRVLARTAARQAAGERGLRVLWTGSRAWAETHTRYTMLDLVALPVAYGLLDAVPDRLGFMTGAVHGLDTYVNELRLRREFAAVVPEVYPIMPGETPIERDHRMIENNPGMVVGVPHRLSKTGGTWATLRAGYAAGIPTYVCREVLGYGWRFERFIPRGTRHTEPGLW